MRLRLAGVLLLLGLRGCAAYEFDHEFWLRVDGSGRVSVTGRPTLWATFKDMQNVERADPASLREAARLLFEASGLEVRRVTLTQRGGHAYLSVSADFRDFNKIWGTPAFPDMKASLYKEGEKLRLKGTWYRPLGSPDAGTGDREGTVAVRFHLPSKVYEHDNASLGVERGNIVSWLQETRLALARRPVEFGALMDSRSILWSTVSLFAAATVLGLAILAGLLYVVFRKGKKAAAA